ncbi:phosphatidylinositol 3-kinase 2 [Eutrema salsugineum]|uniref:phosphatidylinositol 3-kinase 2 n=1 Tax=Eutrema salsugineum TaxID=72664 RepID=UPI000CED4A88|nr:phosphatidylinositol 3-kinase 2 [Eutrema salsugineum]
MDSGNSSSMQSSSGGGGGDQEEYDSRADQSISAFFNNNNTTTVSSNIAGQTQLDSLIANYFNTGWSTDNSLWSATTTKPTDVSSPRPPLPISSEPVFFTNPLQQNLRTVSNNTNTTSPVCSVPADKKNGLNNMATRNPKKRSRVSRRAPTTVLTTDTSNFRAMVQEFTGNPSTPFTGLSSSSPFPRSRFDLFGSSSSSSSRPLKPFPHKLVSSSTVNHHHYLPTSPDYHHDHRHQSLLHNTNTQNITNPFLNNQSPNNPLTDQPLPLSLRTNNGFGHVDVGTSFEGLHDIIVSSSSSMTQSTLNIIHGSGKNSEAENDNDLFRSLNGGDHSIVQRSDGYTPPIASGSENNLAVARNEGMVELSWISSPD